LQEQRFAHLLQAPGVAWGAAYAAANLLYKRGQSANALMTIAERDWPTAFPVVPTTALVELRRIVAERR
jgi:hypothetical protein